MAGFFKKKYIIIALIIILIAIIAYFILPVSVPIITALITALILEPAVKFFIAKFRLNRKVSVLIIFILFSFFIGISTFFVATKVVTEAVKFVENTPVYINNINSIWQKYDELFKNATKNLPEEIVTGISAEVEKVLDGFKTSLREYLNIEKVTTLLSYIPNYLVSFIVYLIALFLFMLELPAMRSGIFNHLTVATAEKVKFMSARLSYVVFGFLKAQLFVSFIIFIVSLIGLLLITPEVTVVMSIIIWVIDLIPIIGSIIILGPWSIYHLLSGNISLGTQLGILAIILLIIRRTVEPKVMGSQIGLSPLATLITMYIGLKLLGVLGLFIGPLILIIFKSAKEAGIINYQFKI